ncbi:glycosyl hydrolase family 28-related protein [Bacillus canaveralius]|uniref:glycosyl hydrolase family 28-related protein n=1 Tax=Bacillus canaveralius TaxID=1403243 RepID=UPI000F772E9C|nr:glycosyl hydrolase family 28-related protein [Bacillus canaveralius]RSK55147.1 hypothetical protein EJA13_03640 [Bacillus canaveralius]
MVTIKKAGLLVFMTLLFCWQLSFSAAVAIETNIVNVKDFGAVGDGITDDTVAIKKALYYGRNKKVYFPQGVYLIADTLTIKENTEVYGANSIIKAKSEGYTMLRAVGHNINIHNLTMDGSNIFLRGLTIMNGTKNLTLQSAEFKNFGQPSQKPHSNSTPIAVRIEGGVENVIIDHVIVDNVFANNVSSEAGWNHKVARGILISPALDSQPSSKNITIQNSSISRIGPKDDGDGIVVQGFTSNVGLKLLNNSFDKNHKRAIKIQSPGALIKGNKINNNFNNDNFYDTYKENYAYDMWSAVSVYANDVIVEENIIGGTGSYSAAIDIAGGNNVQVRGNTITNGENSILASADLIRINKGYDGTSEFHNIVIDRNSLINGRYGVNMVANVTGLEIAGNTFSNLSFETSTNISKK